MIHHVGIVSVSELGAAQKLIASLSLLQLLAEEHVREWDCVCSVYECGGALLEFIVPKSGPLLKWAIEHGGTRLHHVAFQVDDIEQVSANLRDDGVELLTEKPVTGVLGWRVNFVRPQKYGILIELVEVP